MSSMGTKRKMLFEDFRLADGSILDVRSPIEFDQGHIPGAFNLPLFTNDERAEVGTCYKKQGRDEAIKLGFDLAGPKLGDIVRQAEKLATEKTLRIHCARGGLRSRSVAWCLETAGFRIETLEGGYKSYRKWVRKIVSAPRQISILGGLTGTGKTHILSAVKEQGGQVLDLEGLANHRGSSFGGLGMPPQPSTQHFENLIAEQLIQYDSFQPVWIESESRQVGSCSVPEELFSLMKAAPAIKIVRPIEKRLDILTEMYGQIDRGELIEATKRITKKLGGKSTKEAVDLINKNELREACRIILDYYDRSYNAHIKRRPMNVPELDVGELSAQDVAKLLLTKAPAFMN